MTKIFDWQMIPFLLISIVAWGFTALTMNIFADGGAFWLGSVLALCSGLLLWVWGFKALPEMIDFWFGGWKQFRKTEVVENGHETSKFSDYFKV